MFYRGVVAAEGDDTCKVRYLIAALLRLFVGLISHTGRFRPIPFRSTMAALQYRPDRSSRFRNDSSWPIGDVNRRAVTEAESNPGERLLTANNGHGSRHPGQLTARSFSNSPGSSSFGKSRPGRDIRSTTRGAGLLSFLPPARFRKERATQVTLDLSLVPGYIYSILKAPIADRKGTGRNRPHPTRRRMYHQKTAMP